jgi:hypothetical protein
VKRRRRPKRWEIILCIGMACVLCLMIAVIYNLIKCIINVRTMMESGKLFGGRFVNAC